MALQNRIRRLEDIHASQVKQQVTHQSSEESRQWLDNAMTRISKGTNTPQPRTPLPPNASPAKIWLGKMLNEMEMRHEH